MILVVGVNGTGKTTTIGKLAYQLHEAGASVVIGAADTFRAAAAEQLETWAGRAQADFVGSASGSDPAAVAFDAVSAGVSRGRRVVIVDTAGRLHTQEHLMEELSKVRRVIAQRLPGAPHETLLTIDATTGQNGLQQARLFTQAAEVTGPRADEARRQRQGRHRDRDRARARACRSSSSASARGSRTCARSTPRRSPARSSRSERAPVPAESRNVRRVSFSCQSGGVTRFPPAGQQSFAAPGRASSLRARRVVPLRMRGAG